MTNKQLSKKVYKLYSELNELLNTESYKKDFQNVEIDGHLLDAKWYLEMAYNDILKEEE